jgi:hypothetical protein
MDDFSKLSDEELRRIAGIGQDAPVPLPKKPWSGSILPMSEDDKGNLRFDSNAGIVGGFKRALMLPGQVARGEVDPTSPEGINRAAEMATVVAPVNPAVRAGGNFVGSTRMTGTQPAKPPAPSREALFAASDDAYERARNMGVDYSSDAVRNMAAGLRQALERDGILEELAPKSFAVLKKLEQPPQGSVAPLSGIEAARRAFRNAGKDFNNPTDQLAADRLIRGIDEFTQGDVPGSVVAGPAAAARETLGQARGNYAAASRSDRLTGDEGRTVQRSAELRTAAANTGLNLDNTIRARVADLLLDPKRTAGFSDAEKAALERVAVGTGPRNAIRDFGNTFGGGGGIAGPVIGLMAGGQAAGVSGAAAGAAVGLGLPIAGRAARVTANRLTTRDLVRADEMVRQRSPLYESIKAGTPDDVISPAQRDILIRLLMQAQTAEPRQQ